MTPLLSVYYQDRKRVGRDNSSPISLDNPSGLVRTTALFFVLLVFLLGGCVSDRSSKQHPSNPTFFDSPDVESLH